MILCRALPTTTVKILNCLICIRESYSKEILSLASEILIADVHPQIYIIEEPSAKKLIFISESSIQNFDCRCTPSNIYN